MTEATMVDWGLQMQLGSPISEIVQFQENPQHTAENDEFNAEILNKFPIFEN